MKKRMTDERLFKKLNEAFDQYLEHGPRSNEKLKVLHKAISEDVYEALNKEYDVDSLDFGTGKEYDFPGIYTNKKLDINISKDGKTVGGIAVKFVMSNYKQNSINYFESMLGETANIKSKDIPYFHFFIMPEKMPYFKKDGKIKGWEKNLSKYFNKYIALSKDKSGKLHVPSILFVGIFQMPDSEGKVKDKNEYKDFYFHKK